MDYFINIELKHTYRKHQNPPPARTNQLFQLFIYVYVRAHIQHQNILSVQCASNQTFIYQYVSINQINQKSSMMSIYLSN